MRGHSSANLALARCTAEDLLRVSGEVRVFPLLGLNRQWSRHVGPVCEHPRQIDFVAEVVPVE